MLGTPRSSGERLCAQGGDLLRRGGDCATPQKLRAGRYDFRSAALHGAAGAEDQCAGSGCASGGLGAAREVRPTAATAVSSFIKTRQTRVRAGATAGVNFLHG